MDEAATLARFLALAEDPTAGAELHACYAPDAPVCYRLEVTPAAQIPPAEFAAAQLAMSKLREGRATPEVRDLRHLRTDLEADGKAVAWFSGREAVDGTPLTIAVGFQGDRIGWLTLADAPRRWTYREGLLQTVADYAFANGAGLVVPRSWLDVAYYKLHAHARPPLLTLPEARFGCHGHSACCDIVYRIEVAPGAQAVVDAIDWEAVDPALAGTQLTPLPDGRLLVKDAGEVCRFLTADKQCRVHRAAGRAVFTPCAVHPFQFRATPDGVAVTGAGTCRSVRLNLGPRLAERADEIYMRMAMVPPGPAPETYRITEGQEVDWPTFQAAETAVLAMLSLTRKPLRERLLLASRLFDPTLTTTADEQDRQLQDGILARLVQQVGLQASPEPQVGPDWDPTVHDEDLRWLMENLLFAKRYAYLNDLRLAHHVNVLLFALVRYAAARYPGGRIPDRQFWEIGGHFWHRGLAEQIAADPQTYRWLRAPAFALWMLSR